MPQFDQFSFLNQVTWFLFFLFIFYIFLTYFFLPQITYNLKFRKKRLVFEKNKKNKINFEKNNILVFLNNSYKISCFTFELFIYNKFSTYKKNQNIKIKKIPIINIIFNQKINFFLEQRFLLFKKIFISV